MNVPDFLVAGSIWLLCFFGLIGAEVQPLGSTVSLSGSYYFIHPDPVGKIDIFRLNYSKKSGYIPITVLNGYAGSNVVEEEIADALHKTSSGLIAKLEVVVAQYEVSALAKRSAPFVKSATILGKRSTVLSSHEKSLPNGPYFADAASGNTYRGYKLYSDFSGAFTETLINSQNGNYYVLPANVPGQSLAVAVPSRMYYKPTKEKPLDGIRVGIKDIYDIKDIRTSDGNRAWYHFYPPANATAIAVRRLIDAGAVIVGKMKTSQFANGETATADWVDYHEPFNPRGDGYQDTSSSSSGPGAGEGSYPWLDITLGSDTGGSIRGPSEVQGLFGNRPSHGLVSLENVMPLSPAMDTAGFLCRDPVLWATAADVLYGGLKFDYKFPKQILVLSGYPRNEDSPANALLVNFLDKLKTFLSATTVDYDITADFHNNTPKSSPTDNINELLYTTYPVLISKQQTPLVRDPFYEAYAAKHHGRRPFIDPAPLVRWAYGDSFPSSATDDALHNKTIFAKWFNSHVLGASPSTCSDKLLIYVGSSAGPNYRNRYLSEPSPPLGFSAGRFSSFSGAPDYVFPVGQAAYNSTVTKHEEVLPVTIDIMAHRKCDGMLFTLANMLVKEGILKPSVAGRSSVGGKDILFKRGMDLS